MIRDAHRHRDAREEGVVLVPHLAHVAELFVRWRRSAGGDVAEALRRRDDREAFRLVLRVQLRQDRPLDLAVRAPVRPEEENDDLPFERLRGRARQRRPQRLRQLERRRRMAFERQQVDVLLDAFRERRRPVGVEFPLEEHDRVGARAAVGAHLCLDLDRRADRVHELRVLVDRTRTERREREPLRLGRVLLGAIALALGEGAAAQPRHRLDHLGGRALLRPALDDERFGAREIVRGDRRPHLGDQRDRPGCLTGEEHRRQRQGESDRLDHFSSAEHRQHRLCDGAGAGAGLSGHFNGDVGGRRERREVEGEFSAGGFERARGGRECLAAALDHHVGNRVLRPGGQRHAERDARPLGFAI